MGPIKAAADRIRLWLVRDTGRYTASTLELDEVLQREIARAVEEQCTALRAELASLKEEKAETITLLDLSAALGWGCKTARAVYDFAYGREQMLRDAQSGLETHRSNAGTAREVLADRIAYFKNCEAELRGLRAELAHLTEELRKRDESHPSSPSSQVDAAVVVPTHVDYVVSAQGESGVTRTWRGADEKAEGRDVGVVVAELKRVRAELAQVQQAKDRFIRALKVMADVRDDDSAALTEARAESQHYQKAFMAACEDKLILKQESAEARAALARSEANQELLRAESDERHVRIVELKAALARVQALPRYERDVEEQRGGHYGEERWMEQVTRPCATGAWVKYSELATALAGSKEKADGSPSDVHRSGSSRDSTETDSASPASADGPRTRAGDVRQQPDGVALHGAPDAGEGVSTLSRTGLGAGASVTYACGCSASGSSSSQLPSYCAEHGATALAGSAPQEKQ